ncbi:hypothetical protein DSO57_1008982 [Entomophthora muscae]|uniref:Uncharacterized protein n=2 Tax=Entomophthora muscae TaxID=34485 RepID=A0ACC2SK02_9FUNG|nr:hypothetical protein DSO57_1008139 [Entomophthora muscae]KAJ9066497.1 hypothetical protein DSO57_1008982 [Entomophthora muscae]
MHYSHSYPSRLVAPTKVETRFLASLALLNILVAVVDNVVAMNATWISSLGFMALCSLGLALIGCEYRELSQRLDCDWFFLLALPGLLESYSIILSVGWLFNTFTAIIFPPHLTTHFLSTLFPNLLPTLCFINFMAWAAFPILPILR